MFAGSSIQHMLLSHYQQATPPRRSSPYPAPFRLNYLFLASIVEKGLSSFS